MKKIILILILLIGSFYSISYAGLFDWLSNPVGATLRVQFPSQGGTGTGTAPSYGEVLVGTSAGLYEPVATSTLGFTSMTYPDVGIALSTGSAWDTSITNNSTNWNTAYNWGDHIGLYDPLGQATSTLTSHTTNYNHTNYDTAYNWGNHTGLYDLLGQATSTLSSHTTTYNHTNYNTAYGWGDWNGNIDISTDTNLAVSDPIVLTDDTLSFNGVAPNFTATTTVENLDISGDLNVDGNIYGSFTFVTSGNLTTTGDLTVGGNSTFVGTGHDSFSDFVANEHLDWTADLGAVNINTGNYTNTTYTSSDFTHDDLISGTIADHDTSATGGELDDLTDNTIVNTLHRHSELVASDGAPDPALSVNASGNVGIGTTEPDQLLHLQKAGTRTANTDYLVITNSESSTSDKTGTETSILFQQYKASASPVAWNLGRITFGAQDTYQESSSAKADAYLAFSPALNNVATERMRIDKNGNVGIATTNPAHKLDVVGTAGLSTGTAWTNTSDYRFKNIKSELTGTSLEKILALRPISFEWNELHQSKFGEDLGLNYGFVAQEVEEIIPEFVSIDEQGYYWYNPSGMEAILTGAIQEQQEMIKSLEARIEELEK